MRRGRIIVLCTIVAALLALCTMFEPLINSMLFFPERGQWRTPEAVGLEYEQVWIESGADRLQSWWLPGASSADGPVIVFFHGNAGTIADRLENARLMIERLGASVLLVEYPGYGDSTGSPSEESLFAAGDNGLETGRRLAGGRRLVLFGRSLGGAVAVHSAAGRRVDALILESTFTSLAELGRALGFPVAAPLLPYRFDSREAIARVDAPTLILHGDRDEIVPFRMGEALFAASSVDLKQFHAIAGAGHNDTVQMGGERYWDAWRGFLRSVATSPRAKGAHR